MARKPGDLQNVMDLPDATIKSIIRDRIENKMSYAALKRKYGIDDKACKVICTNDIFGEEVRECKKRIEAQAKKNSADVIAHMQNRQSKVISILDKVMEALDDEEKLKDTSSQQLATTLGILVDKYVTLKPPESQTNNVKIEIVGVNGTDLEKFSK